MAITCPRWPVIARPSQSWQTNTNAAHFRRSDNHLGFQASKAIPKISSVEAAIGYSRDRSPKSTAPISVPIPPTPLRGRGHYLSELYCLLRRRWSISAANIIVIIAMRSDIEIHVISVMCVPSKREMPKVTNPIINAV